MDRIGPFAAAKVLHATGQLPIAFEQRYGTDTKLGSTITITGRDGNNDKSKEHVHPTDGKHGVECMVKMTFEKLTAALKRLQHDAKGKVEQLGRVCAGDVSTLYDDCLSNLIATDGENRKDSDYEAIQQYIIQGTTDCTNPRDVQYAAWDQGLDTKGLTVKPSEHGRRFKTTLALAANLPGTEPPPSDSKKKVWYILSYPGSHIQDFVQKNKTPWQDLTLDDITQHMTLCFAEDSRNGKIRDIKKSQEEGKKKSGRPDDKWDDNGGRGRGGRGRGGRGRGGRGRGGRGRGKGRGGHSYYHRDYDDGDGGNSKKRDYRSGGHDGRSSANRSSSKRGSSHRRTDAHHNDERSRSRSRSSRRDDRSHRRDDRTRRSRSRSLPYSPETRSSHRDYDQHHYDEQDRSHRSSRASHKTNRDGSDVFGDY